MASSLGTSSVDAGLFSRICEGEIDLKSICFHRIIVDISNLIFLSAFFLLLLVCFIKQHRVFEACKREWTFIIIATSICCALTGVAFLGAGFWDLIAQNNGGLLKLSNWIVYLVRGLIWISLTVSLLVQRSKWIKILNSAWWASSSLLVSSLNIQILIETHSIPIIDMVQWGLIVLLVSCALENVAHLLNQPDQDESLTEPLLTGKSKKAQSKLGHAGFFSKLTFSWMNSLLSFGYSKPLDLKDIPSLVSEDEANLAYQKFATAWDSVVQKEKNTNHGAKSLVLQVIAKVYLKDMLFVGVCSLIRTLSIVASPLLLYAFVNFSTSEQENIYYGLCLVGILVLTKLIESLSQRHWFFEARRTGMRMRSALMVAIYQKQLKLSSGGRRRHSTGEIVNYIAVDAYKMGEFPWWFHSCWSFALQLFLSIGVLFIVVGLGALPGLVPLLICGLLNVPFAKVLQRCQSKFMVAQDERLRLTSEILNNMKIIKLQSWEEKFRNLVQSLRDVEFKWLSEAQYKKAYGTALYWMSPTIISSVVFLGCVLFKSAPLNASTIFTILATLRTMSEPVRMIPEALSSIIQVKVSLDRINAFLIDDEIKTEDIVKRSVHDSNSGSVTIQAGTFNWDTDSTVPTLSDINLDVKSGQKIAVCGPVGAGKSSLLYAVLGEIPQSSGIVEVIGSIAYVSQSSWIQSGTVRDNILYGNPMDEPKYKKAIKACALEKDINNFAYGDLTEIGQRGINMSGGQKQRIQLARAVYNDADIYLLDDPFSAVDAHTAATLFNDCVMETLATKTVILVTHQVEFLSAVDKILVMKGGQSTQSGSYNDLLTAGSAFEQLVSAHKNAITEMDPSNNENHSEKSRENHPEESQRSSSPPRSSERDISIKGRPGVQLTEEEEKEIGDVGWKPFLDYLAVSKGSLILTVGIIAQCSFVAFQAASTYWLAFGIRIPSINNWMLIGVYTVISTFSAIFVYLRSLFAAKLGLEASKAFFEGFTNAIFRAPMLFFDSTPVGRIFTRVSSDLSILDFDIPFAIIFVMAASIELITTIGIMASVTWQVLIVGIFAMVAAKYVQAYYLASARELIRINGTTKAPVMNYAAETSLGVVTIRAFDMVEKFFHNYIQLIDTDAQLFFYSNAAMEWLLMRIEALQNLTLFTAALLLVLLPKGYVPPGLVGLSLSYALALTGTQVFVTRWYWPLLQKFSGYATGYCNLANYIVSVERIKQFMHIPSEPPAIIVENRPPVSWPSKGRIELHDLKIRYRPNAQLVLKGISCIFREGARVGVVGRTGSGKTTLISALFRLVDPASGKILIDGIDICSIGLSDLRMKLSIIPQEPTLFKGSVRTNLDPLGLYSDEDIWKALEKCQLKETISNLPKLLDSSVSDEGGNWSVGQRQLFCLGRVLLKRNKILVLDEATASIDSATDAILQRVIREEFSDCTVITVAHRVPTVIDSDMVMVLSYGKLVEYDEPSKLIDGNSYFSRLVAEYWSSCRRNSVHNFNHIS